MKKFINLSLILLAIHLFLPVISAQKEQKMQTLELDKSIEYTLKGGEFHSYQITLETNQFLRVLVEQIGVDVVVSLYSPDGTLLEERDRTNGMFGEESLSAEVAISGKYKIEVKSFEKEAREGKYQIKVESPRVATTNDKKRIEAEKAFQDGMKFRSEGTEESYISASQKYEIASQIWNQLGDKYAEGMTLYQLALIYKGINQTDKAIDSATKSLAIHQSVKDRDAEGDDLILLGDLFFSKKEYFSGRKDRLDIATQSAKYYEGALQAKKEVGRPTGEILDSLAKAYYDSYQDEKAIEALKNATEVYKLNQNKTSQINSLFKLAQWLQWSGREEEAIIYYENIPQILQVPNEEQKEAFKVTAESLVALAVIQYRRENFSKSIELFRKAELRFRSVEDKSKQAESIRLIGLANYVIGDKAEALEYFEQSLKIFRSIENKIGEARTLQNMSLITPIINDSRKAELIVQTGHRVSPVSLAFSPDGKTLISAGLDSGIIQWVVETGKQLKTFQGHSVGATSVVFSPDGKMIASSGLLDSSVRLWDTESGKQIFTDTVLAPIMVKFSPDGKTLVNVSPLSIIQYDVSSGTIIRKRRNDFTSFYSINYSPDGKMLASGLQDGTIIFWETDTEKEIQRIKGHLDLIQSVVFSPDGKILASASNDNAIKLWDVKNAKELHKLEAPFELFARMFGQLVFSPNGKTITCGMGNNLTKIWDVESGIEIQTITESVAESVVFSPDGRFLARSNVPNIIKFWDINNKKETMVLEGNSSFSSSATFNAEGNILAHNHGNNIRLWDFLRTKEPTTTFQHSNLISSFVLSPNGKILAVRNDNIIKVWNWETFEELATFKGHTGNINSIVFSPDSKIIASASEDKTIKLWDIADSKELFTVKGHTEPINSISFSHDGRFLASLDVKSLRLWDVKNGNEIIRDENDDYILDEVAFNTHSMTFAVASLNGKQIRLFQFDGKSVIWKHSFDNPHKMEIDSLSFSPDGRLLVSASSDNTIKLWDVEGKRELRTLIGHSSSVSSVSFSPDGKILVSTSAGDMTIRLWDVATGKELCKIISIGENDWAVLTPEGLFDASSGARKLMHFVVGFEVISLEQMKDLYYVPGLLQKIFKGEPLPKVELFSKKDLFPEVEFSQPKIGQENLTIKLTNRGGGIGQVQVLINGKEFVSDARPVGFDANAKETTLSVSLKNAPLLNGEENKIEVVARNAAGSLSTRGSPRGTQIIKPAGVKPPTETPNIYLIASGISNYTGDNLKLNFAAKDAEDFAKAVELGATKLLGDKAKVHIRLLTSNGANSGVKFDVPDARVSTATKADFQQAFADFKNATPNDVFIVYLAGHGVSLNLNQNPNQAGGDTYLYLTQEATTTDKSVLSIENSRKAMTVSSDELKDLMKQNKALKQVLILDTCASGQAAASFVQKRDLPSDQIRAIERLKDNTGFYVLMGSAADAVSYEASQYGQGLLTYSLLQGMKGARLRENQFADISLLFSFAQEQVPQMAKNIGGIQQPRIITPDTSASFDIGKFTLEEQKLINLSNPKPIFLRPTLQNKDLDYDDLELTKLLQAKLREANYVAARGENAALVFVDADEMVDAVKPSGSYLVKGDEITVTLRLIRNKTPVETLTVSGKISQKEELINALVAKITEASKQKF